MVGVTFENFYSHTTIYPKQLQIGLVIVVLLNKSNTIDITVKKKKQIKMSISWGIKEVSEENKK